MPNPNPNPNPKLVAPLSAGSDGPKSVPSSKACDSHLHVIGPRERFPYDPGRAYTAPEAPAADALAMLQELGIERAVFIQCHVHGTDNSAMIAAIATDPQRFRGIAITEPSLTRSAMRELYVKGIRGLRFHHLPGRSGFSQIGVHAFERVAPLMAEEGMHVEFMCDVADVEPVLDATSPWKFPLVLDHYGCLDPTLGVKQPAVRKLERLLAGGRVWLKLSAPYRIATEEGNEMMALIHERLVAANAERVLWGSDWPHTRMAAGVPTDEQLLRYVYDWTPDTSSVERMLVTNPATLYFGG